MTSGTPNERLVEDVGAVYFATTRYSVKQAADMNESGDRTSPTQILMSARLSVALHHHNPWLTHDACEQVIRTLSNPPHNTLQQNNRWFHERLTDGVAVEYRDAVSGETRGGIARLIDFDDPSQNDWLVVRQLTVATASGTFIRPDLTVFLNGLPVAVIELKDPSSTSATLDTAIQQFGRYMHTMPDLFVSNLLLVASDGLLTRVGSITSGPSRFMPWRPADGGAPSLEALIRGLFEPGLFLQYLRSCVTFEEDERGEIAKKIAGYHQFRALRNAHASVLRAITIDAHPNPLPAGEEGTAGDGRGGVVWHTQGSGKSLTMLMLVGALVREPVLKNPTIVVVTDRNDLDDQLFATFAMGRTLLRQTPVQADSRTHLQQLLDRAAGGVVFTTIYKFTEAHGAISARANVIVIADEAHRSQYGFVEGGARWMRESLPNATFVGFTGTPIESDDRSTANVFGEYADIYDIRQAVEDGATKPLYYEARIVPLTVDDAGAAAAEQTLAQQELESAVAADNAGKVVEDTIRVPLEALLGAEDRVEKLAAFIVEHWEQRRAAMEGKAMIVAMSREICMKLYDEIIALRPDWHSDDDAAGVVKVVMNEGLPTQRRNESEAAYRERIEPLIEPIERHGRNKFARKHLAERFKNPDDDFRLVIVCDMWLTGFDCPPAHTMYLDKPLAGHNLMQAIARVNRVYGDKPGGLIVDMLGLADALADALQTYVSAGGRGEAVRNVQGEAVPAMQEAFEQLRGFFHGCNYEAALNADTRDVLPVYLAAIDHVLAQQDGWKRFRELVKKVSMAFAMAVPRSETEVIVDHLAFFQRVAAMMRKRLADEAGDQTQAQRRDVDAAVRQVIGGAVDAGQIIDLFAAAGLEEARLDILSDEFLQRVAALEQKNLALETLRKLLNDQIKLSERTNIVQSKKFREALQEAMLRYTNKAITTAEMIKRLLDLAHALREAKQRGESLGLSNEEAAFYDALADNESAKTAMQDDKLRLMARELTEMVKKMPKLDWTQRESVRAGLRRNVRRMLAKYGYPPDLAEDATQLVLRQAELSTGNAS